MQAIIYLGNEKLPKSLNVSLSTHTIQTHLSLKKGLADLLSLTNYKAIA